MSYFDHSNVGEDCVTSPSTVENVDATSNIMEKSSEANGGCSALDAESITDGNGGQIDVSIKFSA